MELSPESVPMQRRAWDLVTRQNTSASLGRRKPTTHLGDVHIEVHSARDATLFCLLLLACLATAANLRSAPLSHPLGRGRCQTVAPLSRPSPPWPTPIATTASASLLRCPRW